MFFSFLVLSPDDMHPPLKNRLLASSWSCFRSSFFSMLSKVIKGYSISFPIAWITDFKLSQLSQLAWCSWEQFPCNSGFWESLKKTHLMVRARTTIFLTVHPSLCLQVSLGILKSSLNVFAPLCSCPTLFQFLHYLVHCFKPFRSAYSLALEGNAFERPLLLVKFWWHLAWRGDP